MDKPLFELGDVVTTSRVGELLQHDIDFAMFVMRSLMRYSDGDWGDMCDDDKHRNNEAVQSNDVRIFASYKNPDRYDWIIWIITEWDRSFTTILFPDEY